MDLENMNCSLDEIVREAQTMRHLHHPNLLTLHCSFVYKEHLWMVMPYISGGSVLNIMRSEYKDGLDEPTIATIMKPVLQALEYLHKHGIIHRDIKAGNILVEDDGKVLLGDFGVAAPLERGGSWGNRYQSRSTFVGTPCWMAPEVMEQSGYDYHADIWSFGITLLELAHGHAPFARLPPMKVLLMTLQNPPPTLEDSNTPDHKKHFSKHMRELVAKCLQKDPTQRPSASQLLEHRFFKTAHDAAYLSKHLLAGLPTVTERLAKIKAQQASRGLEADIEAKEIMASQQEYRKGVSSWNLDVQALKAAAAELPAILEDASVGGGDIYYNGGDAASGSSSSPGKIPVATAVMSGGGGVPASPSAAGLSSGPSSRTTSLDKGAGTPGRIGAGGGKPAKEHGRFKVYETDEAPPFATPPDGEGGQLMEEHMKQRQQQLTPGGGGGGDDGGDGEGQDKAKRKGRFRYVEEAAGGGEVGPDGKPRLPKQSSNAAALMAGVNVGGGGGVGVGGGGESSKGGSTVTSPTGAPAHILLPPLKELLESMHLHQEFMRELVAAVGDSERGKMGALNALLQQAPKLRPLREETERLRVEVGELRDENVRLRERIRALEGGGGEGGGQ
jgi:serine/threonine-protein kinase OSR1/STK39